MGVQGSVVESPYWQTLRHDFERVSTECRIVRKDADADYDGDGESTLRTLCESLPGQRIYWSQVQQLKKHEEFPIDLCHLAILWKLDADQDGSVTLEEYESFAEYCNEKRRTFGSLDFCSKLQAQCDVDMWEVIRDDRGQDLFAFWMCATARQGEKVSHFAVSPMVEFMSQDSVMTLYEMMKPFQIDQHTDQQDFLQMFQQIGEHKGFMSLEHVELDEYVPVCVVHDWAKEFIAAYCNLFQELGCEPPRKNPARIESSQMVC